ncbi:Uncharacterised protein [Acetobacterium wieringae]|nr:Uncharacterised protein [Acetobacterium wieringae]
MLEEIKLLLWNRYGVNFHIISDWFNHNKTDEKERNNVKIMSC